MKLKTYLKIRKLKDGTYLLNDENIKVINFNFGYQYSKTKTIKINLKNYFKIAKLINEVKQWNKNQMWYIYIGVWNGEIEISYYHTNKYKAIQIAKLYKQIAIWDWKNNKEIKILYN